MSRIDALENAPRRSLILGAGLHHALRISAISCAGDVGITLCVDPNTLPVAGRLAHAIEGSCAEFQANRGSVNTSSAPASATAHATSVRRRDMAMRSPLRVVGSARTAGKPAPRSGKTQNGAILRLARLAGVRTVVDPVGTH